MNLDPLIQAQIDKKILRASYLMRIATDAPVLVWTGSGDIVIGGEVYQGLGILPDVPAFQSLVNGVAARIDITMSGVDAEISRLAGEDANEVRGKQVRIGLQFLDEGFQPLGDPLWVAPDYYADVISTDSSSSSDFGRVRSVTLSIGSATTGRRRPRLSFWTRAQQIIRSLTDAFCNLASRYSAESEIKWPP